MVLVRPMISLRRPAQSPIREIPSSSVESLTVSSCACSSSDPQERVLETPITSPVVAMTPGCYSSDEDYDDLMKTLLEVKYSPREEGLSGFDLTKMPGPTIDERLAAVMTRSPTPAEAAPTHPQKQNNDMHPASLVGRTGRVDHTGPTQNIFTQATQQLAGVRAVSERKPGNLNKPPTVKEQWPALQLSNRSKLNSTQAATSSRAIPKVSSQRQATLLGHVTRTKPPSSSKTSEAAVTVHAVSSKSEITAATVRHFDAELSTAQSIIPNLVATSDAQCQTSNHQQTCSCGNPADFSPCGAHDLVLHIFLDADAGLLRDVGTCTSIDRQRACYCAPCLTFGKRSVTTTKRKLPSVDPGFETVNKRLARSGNSVQQDLSHDSTSSPSSHNSMPKTVSTGEEVAESKAAPAKPMPLPKKQPNMVRRLTLFEGVCKICSDPFPFTATGSSFFCPPCADEDWCGTLKEDLPQSDQQIAAVTQEVNAPHLNRRSSVAEAVPVHGSFSRLESSSCGECPLNRETHAAAPGEGQSTGPELHAHVALAGDKDQKVPLQQDRGVQTLGPSSVQCPEPDCTNRIRRTLYHKHGMGVAWANQQRRDRSKRDIATQASWSGLPICPSCKARKLIAKKTRRRQIIIPELRRQKRKQEAIRRQT